MKIPEELWYGNTNPNERGVKPGSQLHKLVALIARNEEDFLPMLSAQAKEIYEKLRDCHGVFFMLSISGVIKKSHDPSPFSLSLFSLAAPALHNCIELFSSDITPLFSYL